MNAHIDVQRKVAAWWDSHPMTYDWHHTSPHMEGTLEWFEEIDHRFFNRFASWFAQESGKKPFSLLIPYEQLRGQRVLEIGCGTGAHARLLAETGCALTAIDLTQYAVDLTRQRLALWELSADVYRMDAEGTRYGGNEKRGKCYQRPDRCYHREV